MQERPDNYKELKLKLDGIVPPGHGFHRNLLFDTLYASLPRDPQVKVQIYNAEIVPGGYTNWHCHNGAAFFVALQGLFEAHFQEGVLVKAFFSFFLWFLRGWGGLVFVFFFCLWLRPLDVHGVPRGFVVRSAGDACSRAPSCALTI